nr:unnamed protein product [Callosobruchus chinensis]
MEWSQQIVLVLLEEYQKREILWKPRHPLYYNTIKKEDAWREIAAILNVEVQELKKKMESLKGSFRREKSRVKKGTGTGKGPLTIRELQELADQIDLDKSDIENEVVGALDDEPENLLPEENEQAEDIPQPDSDEWDSSDDELLARLVPASSKRWIRKSQFQPFQNLHAIAYDYICEKDPFEYFQKYISQQFFEKVAMFTNMKEVSTTGHSLDTSTTEVRQLFGCSMLIGIYGLPRMRMYWAENTRVPLIADHITRNRFFKLRSRLKVVDDNAVPGGIKTIDRFWKIRPLLDMVERGCRLNPRSSEISIDEQMIPLMATF